MINLLLAVQLFCLLVTILFVLYLRRGLHRKWESTASLKPSVSVLVAARNEEQNLPRCLSSLAAQDYPRELCEFIIVDDASRDGTAATIAEWSARDTRFRLLRLEDAGERRLGPKKRALSAGFGLSRGEIIITTDADCTVSPEWITTMVSYFGDDVSAVCGPVQLQNAKSWWGKLAAFEALANTILNAAVIGVGGALSCAGANFAFRRAAFQSVGGYDQGASSFSGDDDLLLQKMRRRRLKIGFCANPAARVRTSAPADARSYWLRKRRHLSAGKKYAAHWIILAAVVYLGCLTTVLCSVMKIAGIYAGYLFIFPWCAFSISLTLIFKRGTQLLDEAGWWLFSLPAAIFFPFYFAAIQPFSLLPSPRWKDRRVR